MIITDEKILRAPNADVQLDEVNELVRQLEKGLHYSALIGKPGIGLAAPQIRINKKAAIIRIITNGTHHLSVNLINARIKAGYNSQIFKDEGCLSINGVVCDTMRYQEIHVVDNMVKPYSFVATGLLAIAIQHELDHLAGILVTDRAILKPPINSRTRPNDPCFCGSGKKAKRCCLK